MTRTGAPLSMGWLRTGDRVLRVDSWDVYGDNTRRFVQVGDRLTMTGEFENGEFDAFSIQAVPVSERSGS